MVGNLTRHQTLQTLTMVDGKREDAKFASQKDQ